MLHVINTFYYLLLSVSLRLCYIYVSVFAGTVDIHTKSEIPEEGLTDNIIIENINYSRNNDIFENVEEYTNFYSNYDKSDIESELTEFDNECFEHLNVNPQLPLREFLRLWSLQNNIAHAALTKLLKGLRVYGHHNLPRDARTLMETPTKT